ncbi:winged helix-turn-helix transcriptional regulator [Haloplanus ruber]|uniref:Winged helix-turn-helix transcriptional regulator n=1 Tax=Haloplanus ruber TaxID=869892 RepID=A0ABD6CWH6_9EURY|nr:winged helix-turn-helix transcriptional regulator [Haloplanus ruber]
MGGHSESDSRPPSVRQRRILDLAEDHPSASVDELASMLSTGTADLVERVLDEYGDPAADDDPAETGSDTPDADATAGGEGDAKSPTADDNGSAPDPGTAMTDGQGTPKSEPASSSESEPDADQVSDDYPSVADLPEKHREALAAVAARPTATQREIAERLGVTRATVSRWMSSIEGFDWRDRESFVDAVFDDPPSPDVTTDGGPTTESPASADGNAPTPVTTKLDRLEERIAALEASDDPDDGASAFDDPELVHKVVHACLNADTVSEDEELRILAELLA